MNTSVTPFRLFRPSGFWLPVLTTLLAFGCGDKALPTQVSTPTPIPTQGPSPVSMDVTLSRANPPADVKHAALAAVVVRETGGRSVQLARMTASSYFGSTVIQVGGFTPFTLAAGQTRTFTVTLTTNGDIPCDEGVAVTIFPADQGPTGDILGCETADWPF